MANCHDLYEKFQTKIVLTDSKLDLLKQARKALRNKIRNHFKDIRKERAPLFAGQGSFYLNTIVNPIDGDYDIDDGVYLQNLAENASTWPTAETAHTWIYEAVDGHTDQTPKDKRTCIRVLYSREKGQDYHVDLPIYGISGNTAFLAEKSRSPWPESDPLSFARWFEAVIKSKGEQVRRIVRYLKAWSDHNDGRTPMLNGISITIGIAEQFVSNSQDDIALIETVTNLSRQVRATKTIRKPVAPNENLLDDWTADNIVKLCDRLDFLVKKGAEALNTSDKEEASLIWIGQFGSRFPKYEPPNSEDKNNPPILPRVSSKWQSKNASVLGSNPKG